MQRSSRVLAGAALAVVALAPFTAQSASATAEPATTQSAHHPVRTAGRTWLGCPYGDLCVHYYKVGYYGERNYHWVHYRECRVHYLADAGWHATWYVNNQTPGTSTAFWYDDVGRTTDVDYWTGPAPTSGRIPTRYNVEDKRDETPYAVDVC